MYRCLTHRADRNPLPCVPSRVFQGTNLNGFNLSLVHLTFQGLCFSEAWSINRVAYCILSLRLISVSYNCPRFSPLPFLAGLNIGSHFVRYRSNSEMWRYLLLVPYDPYCSPQFVLSLISLMASNLPYLPTFMAVRQELIDLLILK